ncbi:MAG: hypothetical protein ACKVOH_03070 [Chlamydiales bacterium]
MDNLLKLVEEERIPHSLLLAGPKGAGKRAAVDAFITAILPPSQQQKFRRGNHPDVHHYYPEGKSGMHTVAALAQLQGDVAMMPFEAPYKFFLLHDAERMLPVSANALLKTFEEPASQTVIFLLTQHPEKLLLTIRSRCQTFYLRAVTTQLEDPLLIRLLQGLQSGGDHFSTIEMVMESEKKEREKEMIATLPKEMPALAAESAKKEIEGTTTLKFQERLFSLLEAILAFYRDRFALQVGVPDTQLFYPKYKEEVRQLPFVPLSRVAQIVTNARLAIFRGTKLAACLQYVSLSLENLGSFQVGIVA